MGVLVVGVLAVVQQQRGAAGQLVARDPLRLQVLEPAAQRRLVVGDVAERGVALADAVAERRAAVGDRRGADRGRADRPLAVRRVAERHVTGQLAHLHAATAAPRCSGRCGPRAARRGPAGPQITISVLGPKQRREEHQPLDVIEVQVGEQQVQRPGCPAAGTGPAADAGAGVEHEHVAVGERDLHARGVAAVAGGLRARRRHRAARAPDLARALSPPRRGRARRSPSRRGAVAGGDRDRAHLDAVLARRRASGCRSARGRGGPRRSAIVSGSCSMSSGRPSRSKGPKAVAPLLRAHPARPPRSAGRAARPPRRCRRRARPPRRRGRRAWRAR